METFLKKAKKKYGDIYDFSKVIYDGSRKKIIIICTIDNHGEFTKTPNHFLEGSGCQKCSKNKRIKSTTYFIKEVKSIHGDKYDYSLVNYTGANEKIQIICCIKGHGIFSQKAICHKRGQGCPVCGGSKLKTTQEFITQAISIHNNNYNYDRVDYVNNNTKIEIICNIHGCFNQSPDAHLQGQGCPECSGKKKKNNSIFIEQASKVHSNVYDYSIIDYINSKTKIEIICKIHGTFTQTPNSHLCGQGCPECSGNIKKELETFIDEANVIHNYEYSYDNTIYTNNNTNIAITCKIHGDFHQTPNNHIHGGTRCPSCYDNKTPKTKQNFIEEATKIHGVKYKYDRVNYKNNKTKIEIECFIHGVFKQRPDSHLNGCGCHLCGVENKKTILMDFIEKANKIHHDTYDYSIINYVNSSTKIEILCSKHEIFTQTPGAHLTGQGCPKCNKTNGYSKQSIEWLNYIAKERKIFIRHAENMGEYKVPHTRFLADGYCEENNTIFEYLGDFWHGNPNIYDKDCINRVINKSYKTLFDNTMNRIHNIQKIGYNVEFIWESDWIEFKKVHCE